MEDTDPKSLENYTVAQIKEELRFRFLSTMGVKQDLIKRLVEDNLKKHKENIMEEFIEEKKKRYSQQLELEEAKEKLKHLRSEDSQSPRAQGNDTLIKILERQTEILKSISVNNASTFQIFSTADTSQAIPIFVGKRYENAIDWLSQVDRIASLANWSDNLTLVNAAMRLKGQAYNWHKVIGKKSNSWEQWKVKFKERFCIKMSFAEFITFQQKRLLKPSETISEYIYSKNAIFENSPITISEQDKVSLILEGIKDQRWVVPLASLCCTSVEQLLNHAMALDNVRKVSYGDNYNKPVSNFSLINTKEHVSPEKQRSSKFIPKFNPQTDKEQDQTCYRCKEKGHVSYNCKLPLSQNKNNSMQKIEENNKYVEKVSKNNKNQVNCVQDNKVNVTLIPITLNGSILLNALPDSGSVITIVDKDILPPDINVYPWQKGSYKVAGNELTPIGWISARIQVGKIDYIMPQVAICDKLPVPMILGKDWQLSVYARIIHEPDGKICIITPTHTEYFPSITTSQSSLACCVNENIKINSNDVKQVEKLVSEYEDIFKNDNNDIGKFPDFQLEINLKHDKPLSCKPYRLPEPERKFLKETIEKWLEQKICRLSSSPYAAPMFVVEQPFHETTQYRPVVDYSRTINPITILDVQPIPRMEDIIHTISQFPLKFKLDIFHAYHNICIKEKDIFKTAVITQDYHVEFMRVMFGLAGGPSIMSKVVNKTYGSLYSDGVRAYFDDISGGANTIEQLLNLLRKVFQVTREKNLKLNKEKCLFLATEIPLFGRIIGYQQERTDPKRTVAVEQYQTLKSVKEVRSFLGFAGTFRKYIKNFASLSKPLQEILKNNKSENKSEHSKNKVIQLTLEQLQSFNNLKSLITSAPILSNFQQEAETIVETDSSYEGIGACLLQIQNGEKKIIEYASRSLKDAETRYHINELEVTAVHWAIVNKFRIYLLGKEFTLVTDSYSTAYIINKAKFNRKFARYVIDLAPFNFTPIHRPGKQNTIADHLSRYPLNEVCMMVISSNTEKLKLAQSKDPFIQQICKKLQQNQITQHLKQINQSFTVKDNILLHINKELLQNQEKIVVPQSLRSTILKIAHDDNGHLDFETTFTKIKSKYWWKTIRQDVKAYTKSCLVCAKVNRRTKLAYGEMGKRPIPEMPMQVISSDHIVALPQTNTGNTYILVHIDHATRYVMAKPTCSLSAKDVIETIENDIIYQYGPPLTYISDGALCFTSKETQNFFSKYGIEHITTTPYTPQSNGLVERANATIISTLTKFALENNEEWDKLLPKVLLAINISKQKTTKYSPFYLLYGFQPRIPPNEIHFGTIFEDLDRFNQLDFLFQAREQALKNINEIHMYNKSRFDLRRLQDSFKENDYVLYEWYKPNDTKLTPRYKGPYKVIRKIGSVCYEIQDVCKPTVKKKVHVQFLKPMTPPHNLDSISGNNSHIQPVDVMCKDESIVQVNCDDSQNNSVDEDTPKDDDNPGHGDHLSDDKGISYTTRAGRVVRLPNYKRFF